MHQEFAFLMAVGRGCNKGAESRTTFCKAHGGGRRCQELGCTKSVEGKTEFCIAHGGGRWCGIEECSRAARGKSGFCLKHGGGKRWRIEGCTRGAEGHPGLCLSHGGGRRCQHPNCGKGAQGSTIFASPTVEARGACLMAVPEVQRAARPCAKGTAAGRGASLREVVCAQGASMAELASALRMEMEAASAAPCPGAPRALVVALVAV